MHAPLARCYKRCNLFNPPRCQEAALNTKSILAVALAVCLLLSAAIAVCAAVLTRRFDAIEHAQAELQLLRGVQALDVHMEQLVRRVRDHAQSAPLNGTAAPLPAEPGSAVALGALLDLRADALALLDGEGREVQALQIDRAGPGTAALGPALRSQLLQLWSDRQRGRTGMRLGWLNSEQGLLALCAVGVGSDGEHGLLFAGRYFDDQPASAALEIIPLDDPAQPADLEPAVAAWLYRASATNVLVLDDPQTRRSLAHAVLRDISDRPVALLRSATSGDISLGGRRTAWLLMGSLALLLGVGSFALILLILRAQHSRTRGSAANHGMLHALQESMALVDPSDGALVDVNDALLRALDYERGDLALVTLRGIYLDLPEDLGAGATAGDAPAECRMRARDGRLIDAEVTLAPISSAGRDLVCIVGRDISQRKQAEQSLAESTSLFEHLCTHDALTDLPNRTYLQTHLPALLQDAADEGRLLAVLYLDLDCFKDHNESQGPGCGDALLKLVAARLRSELPAHHVLARMGGAEFVVIAPSLASHAAVTKFADELLDMIRRPVVLDEMDVAMTASIGVAVYPQHGLDGDTLIKHADIALYQAKQAGRGHYRLFADDMNLQQSEHVILEQSLRRAIDTDQIQLEYQPVVDLQSGLVTSFEALARWRHPQLGSVPPQRFIPVAERSGLILPLGEQIVRLAILQLHDWQAAGLSLVPVAINVTALQLELTDLAGYVDGLARQYAVDLKWLAFEVTESVWMQHSSKHIATLQQLRAAGSRIYMDDCHAALTDADQLRSLPIDALKLDPRLIRPAEQAADALKTVADTIALAGKLQLMTVAEGVETIEQVEQLRQLGCQCGQGYYFSKPIAPLQCRSLLQHMGEARRFTETVKSRAFRINRATATVG